MLKVKANECIRTGKMKVALLQARACSHAFPTLATIVVPLEALSLRSQTSILVVPVHLLVPAIFLHRIFLHHYFNCTLVHTFESQRNLALGRVDRRKHVD